MSAASNYYKVHLYVGGVHLRTGPSDVFPFNEGSEQEAWDAACRRASGTPRGYLSVFRQGPRAGVRVVGVTE